MQRDQLYLTGGDQRYAPIYMRTDDGKVLLEELANAFYFGMQLAIVAWLPFLRDQKMGSR